MTLPTRPCLALLAALAAPEPAAAHDAPEAATAPRIINVSCRTRVGGIAATPIAGFVVGGHEATPMLIRAAGPALAGFGVTGALADPRLTLYAGPLRIGANDNWSSADATGMAASGAFPFPSGSRDAALLTMLDPGAYTVPLESSDGGTGIALAEVYRSSSSGSGLVNAAMRAHVDTGTGAMIVGFNLAGPGTLRVLLRAVGPRLAAFGVTGALPDPVMTLYHDSMPMAANDNWSTGTNSASIAAVAAAVGAFELPAGGKDAAILANLGAGSYSVVVTGAGGTTGTALVEVYVAPPVDSPPAVGEWGRRADLLAPNSEMSVAEVDGRIYVSGGYPATRVSVATVQVYDLATDTWKLTTPLPVALNHTMSASVGGKLYVIGGQTGTGGNGPFISTVHEYDPARATWRTRAPMPTERGGGGCVVIDGRIYVAGGRPPRGNDFAVYDPATDTWQRLPDLPTQRNHVGMAAVGRRIYVAGGRFEAGFESEMTDRVEMYDLATGTWTTRAPLPRPRGGLNAVAAHGYIHTFGGEGNKGAADGMFPDHDVYDPVADRWIRLDPMPMPVHGVTGCVFHQGLIHLTGGGMSVGGGTGGVLHQVFRPATSYP